MNIKRLAMQIKRWALMLSGNSSLHQAQPSNYNSFDFNNKLYPNNLSSKLNWKGYPDSDGIPRNLMADGDFFYFPIAISQKALAFYDDYILNDNDDSLIGFKKLAEWLLLNQDDNGGWDCWSKSDKNTLTNYSSMAQGQAISVLTRYYDHVSILEKENIYKACINALNLMKTGPLIQFIDNDTIIFEETPVNNNSAILNGHIFSFWGIYDYEKKFNKNTGVLNSSINGIIYLAHKCDRGYWSNYDLKGRITSPFYHQLHLSQLKALYYQTNNKTFNNIYCRWIRYSENKMYKFLSFFIKAFQKVFERKCNEFVS